MSLRFSFLRGFYDPLYLAVTCPMLFLPEEYSMWFTLGDHFWRDSVFSAYWFDSGYLVLPVYGGFVRISFFLRGLLGSCVRFSSCSPPVPCLPRRVQDVGLLPRSCRQRKLYALGWFCWCRRTSRYVSFFCSQAQMLGIMAGMTQRDRRDVSLLQFSDTLVKCLLLSATGAWGFTVPINCGGPAVSVLRRCRIPVVV